MGIFGGNYTKVGPGISKNAPEKNRFFLFFELLGRKFTKLIPLNLIYIVTLLPLIAGVLLSVTVNPQIISDGVINIENLRTMPLFVFTGDLIGLGLIIISIFITGPATCGFTYVLRNMQRQEHTWIFSDFREHFAKNYKQGVVMSIINIIAPFLMYVAYSFYAYSMPYMMPGSGMIASIAKYFIIIISALYIMMQYYVYVMIVTFDMKLKDILRNGLIFSLAKLPLNIFISIFLIIIIGLTIWYLVVGIVCAILITLALMGFFVVYSVYPTIERSMMTTQSDESVEEDEDARDFEDMV